MLHGYTREAGVRQLDRTIAEVARKVPRKLAAGETPPVVITPDDLTDLLGPRRHDYGEAQEQDEVGAVTGVVVSEVGGDIVTVEALAIETKPELVLTGQLGSVMEESAHARAVVGEGPRGRVRRAARFLRHACHPRARPRRRNSQGRSLGGRDHGDCDGVGGDRVAACAATSP